VSVIKTFGTALLSGQQIANAIAYAHFYEIMSEVRKGFYNVEKAATGFKLRHPSLTAHQTKVGSVVGYGGALVPTVYLG
jgi:hypothetical protein